MDREMLRHKLELETHVANWPMVAPHFARGVLVLVGDELDLLDAAVAIAADDKNAVAGWLGSGALRRAEDADAQAFSAEDPRLQFVIVAPFVVARVLGEEA